MITAKVHVKKVLEGNVNVTCNNIWAKMINVNSMKANVRNNLTVEALYNNHEAELIVNSGNVDISLMRGHLKVNKII